MDCRKIQDFLSRQKSVTSWELTRVNRMEHQLYLTMGERECQRSIESENVYVRLYMERMEDGKKVLGESGVTLSPGDDFRNCIKASMEMASLVANEPFPLPAPGGIYRQVETYDYDAASNPLRTLDSISNQILASCEEDIALSSAEIFVRESHLYFLNSLGLELRDKKTRIFADFVLLTGGSEKDEVESHGSRNVRFVRDLAVGGMVQEHARFARDALLAQTPPTGTFDVVFSHEALDTFFNYFKAQSQGPARHQGWSHFEEGKPIVAESRGDRLTLISDPTLPGGLMSGAFDANGLPLVKVEVISQGIFRQRMVNARYAAYLNLPPTGGFTNVVVEAGDRGFDHLFEPEPVLHVLSFSTFEPNAVTGAFSGEIRTGYLVKNGLSQPVKGGSVSGVMKKALEEIYFSRETTRRDSYFGPKGIKVCGLKVAGG
jgi:predicted Zn-dependent protease